MVFWIIAFTVLADGGLGILWFILTLLRPIPILWQLMLIGWILIINLLAAVAAPGGCYCGCGEKNASCCSCLARCTGLCLSSCCVDIDTSYKLGAVLSLITRLLSTIFQLQILVFLSNISKMIDDYQDNNNDSQENNDVMDKAEKVVDGVIAFVTFSMIAGIVSFVAIIMWWRAYFQAKKAAIAADNVPESHDYIVAVSSNDDKA